MMMKPEWKEADQHLTQHSQVPTPHLYNIESKSCLKYCSLGISYFTLVTPLPGESKLRPGLGRLPLATLGSWSISPGVFPRA